MIKIKKLAVIVLIVLIPVILIIFREFTSTCLINRSYSRPIEDSIKANLEEIYNEEVIISSVDGCAEDGSRIVYFSLVNSNETKIALYLSSFLPGRIKYIDEVQNLEKYKDNF